MHNFRPPFWRLAHELLALNNRQQDRLREIFVTEGDSKSLREISHCDLSSLACSQAIAFSDGEDGRGERLFGVPVHLLRSFSLLHESTSYCIL